MKRPLYAIAWTFVGLHVAAMAGAMAGLLVAIPHPETWATKPGGPALYAWALANMGTVDILTATIAMLAWGAAALGLRKTAVFFIVACVLSATAELTGTKTGWPFGGYSYTGFLGLKLGGRVPYTIPLSWFYMGLASFVVANAYAQRIRLRNAAVWSIAFGAYLLTAWDLVLDPAMASPSLSYMQFWQWHERGPYFGMPLRNLAGWFGTGLAFIGLSRLLWRSDVDVERVPLMIPYVVYAINIAWAMALSLSVGLWQTAVAGLLFALAPATLAAFGFDRRRSPAIAPEQAA